MLTKSPYGISDAQRLLDTVSGLLPNAIGLRNDPLVSSRFVHPACINTAYIELDGGKTVQIKIPETLDDAVEDRLVPILNEKLGLEAEQGRTFTRACHALQKLNNIGAWPLQTTEMAPMVANEVEVGDLAYEQGDYLNECVAYLSETLESVNNLTIRYCQLNRGGRWRAWVGFQRAADGIELASIDTAAISLHLEAKLTRRPAKLREINVARVRGWAEQLGCDTVRIPKVLHILTLFVANLSLTRVDLE